MTSAARVDTAGIQQPQSGTRKGTQMKPPTDRLALRERLTIAGLVLSLISLGMAIADKL